MRRPSRKHYIVGGGGFLLAYLTIFSLPLFFQTTYTATNTVDLLADKPKDSLVVTHVETPDPLKAIYMTSCVAGTPKWRADLAKFIEDTELNSIVIDIKDATGRVSFPNDFPKAENLGGCTVNDMGKFIADLHAKGIYVIGRVAVFQDPSYTKIHPELAVRSKASGGVWKDHKGLSFIDVGARPYWSYIVEVAKAGYKLGFDEINFDYVRYPSDGDMKDTNFTWTTGSSTKADMLESFFSFLHDELKDTGMKTSVDIFGMTTTIIDDMGIGQVLERTLPYFDYVDPMVYPSHYPATWNGFANPAEHPYQVIQVAMSSALAREQSLNLAKGLATSTPSKLRPWLQDFNLGATYTAGMVDDQIKATYDVGLNSWLVWNAGNKYTTGAFLKE